MCLLELRGFLVLEIMQKPVYFDHPTKKWFDFAMQPTHIITICYGVGTMITHFNIDVFQVKTKESTIVSRSLNS